MDEKIHKIGLKREKGYLYFIDREGDVSRTKNSRENRRISKPEKLIKIGLKQEEGYLYFLDKNGDISRKKYNDISNKTTNSANTGNAKIKTDKPDVLTGKRNINEFAIRDFFYNSLQTYGLKIGYKELSIEGLRIDIFAIDAKHNPYILEFKKGKDRHIVGQAAQYLALIPTYRQQIEKKLNFFDIKWDNIKIICIAQSFSKRDFQAANYAPLKEKVYFYSFQITLNSRGKIFALNLKYSGNQKDHPLLLPEKIVDKYDVKQMSEAFHNITNLTARREYYSRTILPFLKNISSELKEFEKYGLYQHNSLWKKWFLVRFGTGRQNAHRISIAISFFKEGITYGFDLTHSFEEAQKLKDKLANKSVRKRFIANTLKLEDYFLYIPNSGIKCSLPLCDIDEKGLNLLLDAYQPKTNKDCYLIITKEYEQDSISLEQAANVIREEYKKFKYIFDLLK
ncbi:MAG: hypothetical protein LBO62_07930 [Endomicrobium sp.]|jgi:hypothetical protein|nr:hypothetical protein [Endomicrobium sp.]